LRALCSQLYKEKFDTYSYIFVVLLDYSNYLQNIDEKKYF